MCVKGKTHATKPIFASTTGLSKILLSLNRTIGHYVMPLAVVVQGSVSVAESGCMDQRLHVSSVLPPAQGRSVGPHHTVQDNCKHKQYACQQLVMLASKLSVLKAALAGAKFPKTVASAWLKRSRSP